MLDRVLHLATHLFGGCPSFLPSLPTCLMHYIGCLSLSEYRIVSLQWSPVVSFAAFPPYLCDLWRPVSVLAAHRVLRSAVSGELLVPWARLAVMKRRAFSVVSPLTWNDL